MNETPAAPDAPASSIPSPRRQSWGALIAIVTIVLMLVIGALYAWGNRSAQMSGPSGTATTTY